MTLHNMKILICWRCHHEPTLCYWSLDTPWKQKNNHNASEHDDDVGAVILAVAITKINLK